MYIYVVCLIIFYTAKGDGDDKTKAKKVLSSFRQDTQVYDIANGDQSDKVASSGAKRNRGKAEETSKQEYDVISSQKDDRIKLKPNIVYRLGKGKDKVDDGYVNEAMKGCGQIQNRLTWGGTSGYDYCGLYNKVSCKKIDLASSNSNIE